MMRHENGTNRFNARNLTTKSLLLLLTTVLLEILLEKVRFHTFFGFFGQIMEFYVLQTHRIFYIEALCFSGMSVKVSN